MTSTSCRLFLSLWVIGCEPAKGIMTERDPGDDPSSDDAPEDDTDTTESGPDEEDSGSSDSSEGDTGEDEPDPPEEPAPLEIDYGQTGPYSTSTSSVHLSTSCSSSVEITLPTEAGEWPRIILAHGFMRAPAQVAGWADHLASWGIEVVAPTLCHASILDTDHEANGRDLVTLNDTMGGGAVIYAGHSAGGLAALIATALDPRAIGLVGLDLTDADGLGLSHASGVSAPTYALAGEPSSCNSEGNGVTAMSAVSGANQVRITDADHCDFENETDWMCTSFCTASDATFTDGEIQDTVLGLFTAAAMNLGGVDPDADLAWWRTGGVYYDGLLVDGGISSL